MANQVLADSDTPVSILQKCYEKDKACFLLESVEGGERWGRYSFLGVSAFGHIKIFKTHVLVETRHDTKKIDHNNDPLSVMRDVIKKFTPADIPDLPRFWSGITGYFAYEIVSFSKILRCPCPRAPRTAILLFPSR